MDDIMQTVPPKRSKGRPREFDRQKALDAALRIFWAKGFEPTTLPELCQAMGINPPSLYAAFGNKAQLFLEAVHYYERTYWHKLEENFQAEPNIHKAIRNYFEQAAGVLASPDLPCGCMIVVAAVNISDSEQEIIREITAIRQATRLMFLEKLRTAIREGQIPPDTDAPALAGALNALLEGMSLLAKEGLFQSELKAIAAFAPKLLPDL